MDHRSSSLQLLLLVLSFTFLASCIILIYPNWIVDSLSLWLELIPITSITSSRYLRHHHQEGNQQKATPKTRRRLMVDAIVVKNHDGASMKMLGTTNDPKHYENDKLRQSFGIKSNSKVDINKHNSNNNISRSSSQMISRSSSSNDDTPQNMMIRNLHLAFMGDSITMYQYLDLIYHLHSGGTKWVQNNETPNLVRHPDHVSWFHYLNYTNAMFDGIEKCDCWRGIGDDINAKTPVEKIFEVRYYADRIRNNYIAYIPKFGLIPAQGHWHPDVGFDTTIQPTTATAVVNRNYTKKTMIDLRMLEHEYQEPLWQYDWIDAIRYHIANLHPRPQYLILNAGIWPHDLRNLSYIADIQHICRLHNITTIYRTTTAKRGMEYVNYYYEKVACDIFDMCHNVSWTNRYNEEYYFDWVHFQPNVNQLFNEQLLHIIHNHSIALQKFREE